MYLNFDFSGVPIWIQRELKKAREPFHASISTRMIVNVDVHMTAIDGRHGTLAQAAPTAVLRQNLLPVRGVVMLDVADLYRAWVAGTMLPTMVHEVFHVLGMGTLPWWYQEFLSEDGLWFTGPEATRQWRLLSGREHDSGVPVEPGHIPGTSGAHWAESILVDEIFTGFLSGTKQPVSRVTLGALADLGWTVDYDQADAWEYRPFQAAALLGTTAPTFRCRNRLVLPLRSVGA